MRNNHMQSIANNPRSGVTRHVLRAWVCATLVMAFAQPSGRAGDQSMSDSSPRMALAGAGTVVGFTAPFRIVTLAALHPGRIEELPVAEGESVAAGQPVILLDDTVQRRRVEIARVLAESTVEVELARVRHEHARRQLERLESLAGPSSVSTKELGDARTDVEASELEFQQARMRHEQAVQEHALQEALCAEMHVRSPFAGYVSAHLKQVGDSVEDREGVLTLVQLDPLVVALDCPLELAANVACGQEVTVRPIDGVGPVRGGEVFFVSKVGDPASQTFKIKIRVPNKGATWMAGMRVSVSLDEAAPITTAGGLASGK